MYFLIEFDWLFLDKDVKIISTFWIVLDGCHLKWARPKSERGRREPGSLVRREKSWIVWNFHQRKTRAVAIATIATIAIATIAMLLEHFRSRLTTLISPYFTWFRAKHRHTSTCCSAPAIFAWSQKSSLRSPSVVVACCHEFNYDSRSWDRLYCPGDIERFIQGMPWLMLQILALVSWCFFCQGMGMTAIAVEPARQRASACPKRSAARGRTAQPHL